MPAPLIWLGAGLAALYAGDAIAKQHSKHKDVVRHYPGEWEGRGAVPRNGSVVCTGIYGVFDHTGIWVDGDIIELKGNGLIRSISPQRFVDNRSGETIYVACDDRGEALIEKEATQRAINRVFDFEDYHVLHNNCHRFVWQCLSGQRISLTSFLELNNHLSRHFHQAVNWIPISNELV